MKENNNSVKKSESRMKRRNARAEERRDSKTLEPLLRLIQTLSEEIRSYEKRIETVGNEKYMQGWVEWIVQVRTRRIALVSC